MKFHLAAGLTPAFLAALGMTLILLIGCNQRHEQEQTQAVTGGGNSDRGQQLITQYGCPSCHTIPGVKGPKGAVGPPLENMAVRPLIGGKVENTPQNMIAWLQNPQAFDPGSSMPNLNVKPGDARDITAYLFTLR